MRPDPSKIIPTSADTPEQWVLWHKLLKGWFTKKEANSHWLRFWNQRAGAGSAADTHDLRSYMEGQGIDLTTDTKGKITDSVMDVVDWGVETANWVRGIIIGGVILGIGLIAYYIVKSTNNGKSAGEMVGSLPISPVKGYNTYKLIQ